MEKGIRKIFSEVHPTYELLNHLLTFGLDIFWRRKAAKAAVKGGGRRWLDVCSGTGELAIYLRHLAKKKTKIIALDFSRPMIYEAKKKTQANQIAFILADAKTPPFGDETFDLVTISFATRNINLSRDILIQHLQEFYRVLKPGGRLLSLETSQPSSRLLRKLFHLYVQLIVKPLGTIISGSRVGYVYLSKTIPRFYNADEFKEILRQAGFAEINFHQMTFGLVAFHQAVK